MAVTRHIRAKYPDLAIGDLYPPSPCIGGPPRTSPCPASKSRSRLSPEPHRHRRAFPRRSRAQYRAAYPHPNLCDPRSPADAMGQYTGRFRAHPTRLARFIAHQRVQILPRAVGHTLLTKQRTNSLLHIHKRRFTDLQRPPKRGSCHPCSSDRWWPIQFRVGKKNNCSARSNHMSERRNSAL